MWFLPAHRSSAGTSLRVRTLLVACTTWLFFATPAAQADKVAAEALFSQGRKLMAESNFAAACSKFEASQRLDPAVGTMLNLAACYEKSGRTASAWAQYREASAAARAAGSSQREEYAREKADALEPTLSRMRISTWKGQEVQVRRDGVAVDSAELGSAMPIDPGEHEVTATATGKRTWSTKITIGKNRELAHVTVPILPADDGALESANGEQAAESSSRAPVEPAPLLTPPRVGAIVAGAIGLAGLTMGTVFGIQAKNSWDDAMLECDSNQACTSKGVDLGNRASAQASLSTVSFAVGVVGLGTGVVLWLLGSNADSPPPVAISPTGVMVNGKF